MSRLAWCLVVAVAICMVVAVAAQPAAAQEAGTFPNVSALTPFTAEANYMSMPGYLRWQTYLEQKVWISVPEAKRIVSEQTGK